MELAREEVKEAKRKKWVRQADTTHTSHKHTLQSHTRRSLSLPDAHTLHDLLACANQAAATWDPWQRTSPNQSLGVELFGFCVSVCLCVCVSSSHCFL